jgi:hypothetical protein
MLHIDIVTAECIKLDEAAKQVEAGSINQIFTEMRKTLSDERESEDAVKKLDAFTKQYHQQHIDVMTRPHPPTPEVMAAYNHLQNTLREQQQLLQQHQALLRSLEQQWQQQKGPFAASLDKVIDDLGVHRQAYHGGAFVGNDCLSLLLNARLLSNVLRPRTLYVKPTSSQRSHKLRSQQQQHPNQDIHQQFGSYELSERIFALLHKTKQLFDLAYAPRPLCKHEQVIFIMRACSFGCWFPRAFPTESITPKMHIVIIEMCKLVQRYSTIGMFSEQAIESLHVVFNKLNRQHVSMKCNEKRIESMMKKAWIFHHPAIQSQ